MRADGVASLIVAARLAWGGIREHDAFLGHEMMGPAGEKQKEWGSGMKETRMKKKGRKEKGGKEG